MNRDPLREQILQRLAKLSDGNLFEACVCDLLRTDWPTLIPQPGGNDAGVDGVWSTGNDRGILVSTIREDVIGNVTKNLKEHAERGKSGLQVLVVTSQELSPQRCRNIEARIEKLGFISASAPYHRQAIADRLYHNSVWLKELLGLAGAPAALATVPKSLRPLRDIPLIGRDADIAWLMETVGDRLIVGQPGVGKTFLCQQYVNGGHGLFVVDDDLERIAQAIRDQQPSSLIVEDAHCRLDLIERLRGLRTQIRAEFAIIADTWPGDAGHVRNALLIGETQCRTLAVVSENEIVEILKSAGVYGPPILLHRLIQQSMGMPGRAALLAHLCALAGDARHVYEGTELARWAYSTFERLIGRRASEIIAGFAIGGAGGMSADDVASVLGFPLGDVINDLRQLAHGGIIHQRDGGVYCVLPEPLRSATIRDKFFGNTVQLPLDRFMELAPSRASCVKAIIHAYAVGAEITPHFLVSVASPLNNDSVWEALLWSSPENAKLALHAFPDLLLQFPRPCLRYAPNVVLPALLEAASDDSRQLNSSPDHPLRLIDDWVKSAFPGDEQPLQRRSVLWNNVRYALKTAPDRIPALRSLSSVFRPDWEVHNQVPGSPNSFTFSFGFLSPEDLTSLAELWTEVLNDLRDLSSIEWYHVLSAADQWIYSGRSRAQCSPEHERILETTANAILHSLSNLAAMSPGVLATLVERAEAIGCCLPVEVDHDFITLFPSHDYSQPDRRKERAAEQQVNVDRLVDRWLVSSPDAAANKLAWCVGEAAAVSRNYPDYSPVVASRLAESASDINSWIDALIFERSSSQLILPFIEQLRVRGDDRWAERVRWCLTDDSLRFAAFQSILGVEVLDPEFEAAILEHAPKFLPLVSHRIHSGEIPQHRVRKLLGNGSPAVSGAVASALWERQTHFNGAIPNEIRSEWRQAVLDAEIKPHELCEILASDAELAFQWLTDRTVHSRDYIHGESRAIAAACARISAEQRIRMLEQVDPSNWRSREIVGELIGNDSEIYKQLLQRAELERLHLVPLHGKVDDKWAALAIAAMEEGIDVEHIASAAFQKDQATFGSVPSKYEQNAESWEQLLTHPDSRIRDVASLGRQMALDAAKDWRQREETSQFWETYNE